MLPSLKIFFLLFLISSSDSNLCCITLSMATHLLSDDQSFISYHQYNQLPNVSKTHRRYTTYNFLTQKPSSTLSLFLDFKVHSAYRKHHLKLFFLLPFSLCMQIPIYWFLLQEIAFIKKKKRTGLELLHFWIFKIGNKFIYLWSESIA